MTIKKMYHILEGLELKIFSSIDEEVEEIQHLYLLYIN